MRPNPAQQASSSTARYLSAIDALLDQVITVMYRAEQPDIGLGTACGVPMPARATAPDTSTQRTPAPRRSKQPPSRRIEVSYGSERIEPMALDTEFDGVPPSNEPVARSPAAERMRRHRRNRMRRVTRNGNRCARSARISRTRKNAMNSVLCGKAFMRILNAHWVQSRDAKQKKRDAKPKSLRIGDVDN